MVKKMSISNQERVGVIAGTPSTEGVQILLERGAGPKIKPLQYLVAEAEDGVRVLLRVTKIEFKDKFSGAHTIDLEIKTGLEPHPKLLESLPGRMYVAEADIVDSFRLVNGKIRNLGPSTVPRPRSPVYKADNTTLSAILTSPKHPIRIGKRYGTDLDVELEADSLMRHMVILGTTGSGKSWFRGVLMEELFDLGVPQINFDYLGDYEKATEQLGGLNLLMGKDLKPRLDYLSAREFELMTAPYSPTDFQRAIAREGFKLYKQECRKQFIPPEKLPKYVSIAADEFMARDETKYNTIGRVSAFLESYPIFGRGFDWVKGLREYKLINIVFPRVDEDFIRFSIAAVLRELEVLRDRRRIPPLVVSFEEAHMIVPRSASSPISGYIVKRLLRYSRHMGIALILITQSPKSVDREVTALPATKVIFAINPDELEGLRGMIRDLGSNVLINVPKMEVGTAIISSTRDIIRHSLYVRIRSDRRTEHGGKTPSFFQE